MLHILKPLLFVITAVLLSGCKIATIVVEGGYVSQPGRPICEAGEICVTEVAHANFQTDFRALPRKGFVFHHWNMGDGFLCGGSKSPVCVVSLRDVNPEIAESIVASSETLYLMPIFRLIKDIIEVDGKEWYQPYLFTGLSWNEINAVCPDGVCTGTLNGQDMTGWAWASVKDMNDLLNYYIGSDLLGPGPDHAELGNSGPNSLFEDGWYFTWLDDGYIWNLWGIAGFTKDALNTDPDLVWTAAWLSGGNDGNYYPRSASTNVKTYKDGNGIMPLVFVPGAWFYRVP